ncbi:MAG: hypothetical protein ACLGI5_02705 [Thermoleophilia bacterium]
MRALNSLPRLAELSLEATRQAASLGLSVVRAVAAPILGHDRSDDDLHDRTRNHEPRASRPAAEPAAAPRRAPPPVGQPAPVARAAARPAAAPAPAAPIAPIAPAEPPAPIHVEREAVVVAESADAGAADGAGAELRIPEPWDGYGRLKAKDVTAQLATADPATLAVVRLYESSHRKRRTVLAEIDRRLRSGG